MIDLDFAGVEASGFRMVTPGFHTFLVTKVEDKTTEEKPHVIVTLTCQDAEEAGSTMQHRLYFHTDGAMGTAKLFLQHALNTRIEGNLSEYLTDWSDLVGAEVSGPVVHNPVGDKTYANLAIFEVAQPD